MRLLRIVLHQCNQLKNTDAIGHLGSRLSCKHDTVEHAVITKSGVVHVKKKCDSCIYAKLQASSFILGQPILLQGGLIQFLVAKNRAIEKLLKENSHIVVEAEEINYKDIVLTPRQKEALAYIASNGTSISHLAKYLGITKPAALKLARKSLKKLARLHTGDGSRSPRQE